MQFADARRLSTVFTMHGKLPPYPRKIYLIQGVVYMAFCSNCGHKLIDNAKFCANCGTPVACEYEKISIRRRIA